MIIRYTFILLAVIIITPFFSNGQPPVVDSLKQLLKENPSPENNTALYNQLGIAYMRMGVLDTAYSSFLTSVKSNNESNIERVKSLSEIGNILSVRGQHKEGLDTLSIALDILSKLAKSIDVQKVQVRVYKYMGDLYSRSAIYDKSIEYFQQSTLLAKELKDEIAIGKNKSTLAINFSKLKDYKKAIIYNREAVQVFSNLHDNINLAKTYTNIATMYKEQGSNDSATLYNDKAETLYKSERFILGMPNIYSLRAELLADEKKYSEAINLYKELLLLDNDLGLYNSIGYDYQALGMIYQKINHLDSSNHYLKQSLSFFEQGKMNKELANTLQAIANNYLQQGNISEAKHYFILYGTANETYIGEERLRSISNAEIRYETSLKEAQLAKQKAEIRATKQKNNWLLGGALIFGVVSIVLAGLYRVIRKKNKIIAGQKAEILHFHDNSLTQLRSMFKRQSELQLLGENVKTNEERVKVLSILHELLHGEGNISGDLKEYLEKICDIKSKETDTDIVCDIPHTIQLKPSFLKDIGIITNEVLTNAVKYAFNNKAPKLITLKAVQKNSNILLHISDNGQGLPADFTPQKTTGFGMGYVADLVEQHDGEIKFYNKEGANFEIKLAI